ncbi:hypothetical protein BGZ65_003000 [Modicella reniformis]|uniref:Uncharacterized protein n=1 Tax=Modicella reniformis TaxID=1440133 RepID=A0A9P6M9H7_9FUNG|nr:hypothetical protein BGZ65_003000 [Modicella reniformis]
MTTAFNNKLAALEDYSRRTISTEFTTPRLYSSLLLERQEVSVRRAKPFEQNLFDTNGSDMLREEGADEFEEAMALLSVLNEICQNKSVQARLEQIASAHVDVLNSIANLNTQLTELKESNSVNEIRDAKTQDGDLMPDILREEREIFALEQMLGEKRQLLHQMQIELDGLIEHPESELVNQETNEMEEDPELEAETVQKKLEIERLDRQIQEQRQQEEEQLTIYEELLRESNELSASQQDSETVQEDDSSFNFNEIVRLWNKAKDQNGDTKIQAKGIQEAYLKLERLLDNLERCQRHIVNLDMLQQISIQLVANCADPTVPEFDPPRTINVILTARTLQLIMEAGGSIPLQELKDQIGKEAVERGESEQLGIQALYTLVASYLIQIDRSQKPNLVSFT